MRRDRTKIEQMLDRQQRMFRIAQDPQRYGLSLKMIAMDAKIGYDSVCDYAAGKTVMSLVAIDALVDVMPDELLSLLLPDNRQIIAVPNGVDHDVLEAFCRDYLRTKGEAHHPDSPAGREIAPCEDSALCAKAARLAVAA